MSCGISTSFPVLSPIRRQVAHALLTRPPLLHPRRNFAVRLECVMHAASVHPEPGSNSLKNGMSFGFARVKSFFRVNWFAQLLVRVSYWLWLAISLWLKNSKEFSESLYFGHQNTWILLFNFQWAVLFAASPRGSQLIYYTTLSFACQEVFQTFFKFFRSVPSEPCFSPRFASTYGLLSCSSDSIPHSPPLVKWFFKVFPNFWDFLAGCLYFTEISFHPT